jgi:hypothetical protein
MLNPKDRSLLTNEAWRPKCSQNPCTTTAYIREGVFGVSRDQKNL